ncbi:MFS transporter [Nocardia sp. NPDC004711]
MTHTSEVSNVSPKIPTAPPPELDPPRTVPRTGLAFSLGAIGYFMITIDLTICSVAMSSIGKSVGLSPTFLSWVTTAFTLIYAGFMMFGGRVVDIFGRRKAFAAGLSLFTVASLVVALAPNPGLLIGARAVQGVGAAIVTPCTLALILDLYPEGAGRRRAMGVFQAVIGSGAGFGLVLGGVLTDAFGWRWLFLINVPIGAIVAALAPRYLPVTARGAGRRRFDVAGAATITGALAVLIYTLAQTATRSWASPWTILGLAVTLVLLASFGIVEHRSADPLLPLRIPKNPVVWSGNVRAALVSGTFLAALVLVALDDEQVLGHSPTRAGLSTLPAALMILVAGRFGPRVVGRIGIRYTALTMPLVLAAGLFWFAAASGDNYLTDRLPPDLLIGFGATVANLANMLAATSGAQPTERGVVSALQYTAQQTGQSATLAALTAVAAAHTTAVLTHHSITSDIEALHSGFHLAFLVAGACAVISAALALPKRNFTN